jgi:hypothetical protein
VIHQALGRPTPVELTADRRITRRVKRLSVVSAVVLGLIWALASWTLDAPPAVEVALMVGWVLMPLTLVASLWRLTARYWLVLPSTLVSLGLLAISIGWLPAEPAAAGGWLLATAGVLLGGAMGLWLWFRVLPVPAALDDPGSTGRWTLIAVHVALVVAGVVLVLAAAVSD